MQLDAGLCQDDVVRLRLVAGRGWASQGHGCRFDAGPTAGGPHGERTVVAEHRRVVPIQQVVAVGFGCQFGKAVPHCGQKSAQPIDEPVDLGLARQKDSAQNQRQSALRMALGVGQRQCRPPRAAKHHPAFDAKLLAQALHVVDQVGGGVVFDMAGRRAAPAAALVEQHCAPAQRVEKTSVRRPAAAARPAVEKHHRLAIRPPRLLEVDRVTVLRRQKAAVKGFNRGKRLNQACLLRRSGGGHRLAKSSRSSSAYTCCRLRGWTAA